MFVKRNTDGRIVAVSAEPSDSIDESVAPNSAELRAFIEAGDDLHSSLAESDLKMARVLEDTINVLMDKGILRFTDLPEAAQQKLMHRREIRGRFNAIDLLDDDDDIGL